MFGSGCCAATSVSTNTHLFIWSKSTRKSFHEMWVSVRWECIYCISYAQHTEKNINLAMAMEQIESLCAGKLLGFWVSKVPVDLLRFNFRLEWFLLVYIYSYISTLCCVWAIQANRVLFGRPSPQDSPAVIYSIWLVNSGVFGIYMDD